jgi:raffinose/stachyose/melibiose transport system permease protein
MKYVFGRGRERWTPVLLLIPGMFFYAMVALGPSLATTVYSFTDVTGIKNLPVNWIGFDNYEEFMLLGMASRDNIDALIRTLKFSFLVSTIQFAVGLLVAVLLNQRLKGTKFFRTLFFFPVILGVTIQGMIWELFFYPLDGPMTKILALFGMQSELLGGLPDQAFLLVVFVQIWANMGITMVIFLSGLQTIPDELVEAARIDGASRWQVFKQVTWPLLTPSVNTNLLLNIIGSLQAWQLFYLLLGYRNGTQVLGYLVFAQGFGQTSGSMTLGFRQGFAAAASIVLFILVLILGLSTQYFLKRREERILGAEL